MDRNGRLLAGECCKMKNSTSVFFILVLLSIVSGCTSARYFTEDTVIGVWVESDSRNLKFPLDQPPCFEFEENGEFWAYGYPEEILMEGGNPVTQPLNGYGRWSFESDDDPLGEIEIRLQFNPNSGSKFTMGFESSLFATRTQIESVDRMYSWPENDEILYLKKDPEKTSCK